MASEDDIQNEIFVRMVSKYMDKHFPNIRDIEMIGDGITIINDGEYNSPFTIRNPTITPYVPNKRMSKTSGYL